MARVLSIQSQVIYGHVGNSIAGFALQRLGHEVMAVPTCVMAHHPGHHPKHGRSQTQVTSPKQLAQWLKELETSGWLKDCDAIITGYFAEATQIKPVAELINRLKLARPDLLYLCDPVFGDSPKGRFVDAKIPAAMARELLPLAHMASPNAFEAAELSQVRITEPQSAMRAAEKLGPANVFITSVPLEGARNTIEIGTVGWQRPGAWREKAGMQKTGSWLVAAPRFEQAPHGTGDLFSALLLGHMLNQLPVPSALRKAAASISDLVGATQANKDAELPLVDKQSALEKPRTNVSLTPLGAGAEGQWVAGANNCPAGWLVVLKDLTGYTPSRFRLVKTFAEVMELSEMPSVIAVDVPIGIPNVAGRGGRDCDTAARSAIGTRRSAVFTPPSRSALAEDDFNQACLVNLKHSIPPRKVSKQTFGIFDKIREVDEAISPVDQARLFECHPEVAYWIMNGERSVATPKRIKNVAHGEGLANRRSLLASSGFGVKFLASFDMHRAKAGQDHFLDACACAFTAERIARGDATQMPEETVRDATGLRMAIWG